MIREVIRETCGLRITGSRETCGLRITGSRETCGLREIRVRGEAAGLTDDLADHAGHR